MESMKGKISSGFFVLSVLPWVGFGIYVVLVTAVDGFTSPFGPEGDRLALSLSFAAALITSAFFGFIGWWLNDARLPDMVPTLICVSLLACIQLVTGFLYTTSDASHGGERAGSCINAETIFFGGSGMRGAYVRDMAAALDEGGWPEPCGAPYEDWSTGSILGDVFYTLTFDLDATEDHSDHPPYPKVKHLIGYSYGGLQAARLAIGLTKSGQKSISVTLIATPISSNNLAILQSTPGIGPLRIVDLEQYYDPIRTGRGLTNVLSAAPALAWQFFSGSASAQWGHFHLTDASSLGSENRRLFVKFLGSPENANE